jgi:hypothetical protein
VRSALIEMSRASIVMVRSSPRGAEAEQAVLVDRRSACCRPPSAQVGDVARRAVVSGRSHGTAGDGLRAEIGEREHHAAGVMSSATGSRATALSWIVPVQLASADSTMTICRRIISAQAGGIFAYVP